MTVWNRANRLRGLCAALLTSLTVIALGGCGPKQDPKRPTPPSDNANQAGTTDTRPAPTRPAPRQSRGSDDTTQEFSYTLPRDVNFTAEIAEVLRGSSLPSTIHNLRSRRPLRSLR